MSTSLPLPGATCRTWPVSRFDTTVTYWWSGREDPSSRRRHVSLLHTSPPHIATTPPRLRKPPSPPHDPASPAHHPPRQVKSLFRTPRHPVPPLSWTPEGLLNYCPGKSGALYGTPGIALGRALLWRVTRNDPVARDAERAVSLTLQSDVVNDGLCHGSLGNVDCCMVAAEIMGRDDWREAAYQKAAGVRWRARDRRFWITGSPGRNIGLHGLFYGEGGHRLRTSAACMSRALAIGSLSGITEDRARLCESGWQLRARQVRCLW